MPLEHVNGQIDLPASVALSEIHRVLINQDQRFRKLERQVPGVASASSSSSLSTSTSLSTASSSTPAPTAPTQGVQLIRLNSVKIDPADGLPMDDGNGFAVVEEHDVAVPSTGMSQVIALTPFPSGLFTWNPPADFDEESSYVDIQGLVTAPLRIETTPGAKIIAFLNSTTTTAGSVSSTVTLAQAGASPADAGIILPRGSAALIQSNPSRTALELA